MYAVSTTQNAGTSTSLLKAPGYVTSDASGNFDITDDYTCPANGSVYLLATGGNPGLTGDVNNAKISLAAGLGSCAALQESSYFTVNEVTTVALAYVLRGYASSATNIGATSANALEPNFAQLLTFIDPVTGTGLQSNPSAVALDPTKLNSLADSLAACVNSTGVGDPCATLLADTGAGSQAKFGAETGGSSASADTFQAVIHIAQNPSSNVSDVYSLGAANGPFQPSLAAAPADWTLPIAPLVSSGATSTAPFFAGETEETNGAEYLSTFGYYQFVSSDYLLHFGLGYEFFADANDGSSGLYLFDVISGHTWYTSPKLWPYIYDYNLVTFLYYFDSGSVNGYVSGPRTFYDFNTQTYITL